MPGDENGSVRARPPHQRGQTACVRRRLLQLRLQTRPGPRPCSSHVAESPVMLGDQTVAASSCSSTRAPDGLSAAACESCHRNSATTALDHLQIGRGPIVVARIRSRSRSGPSIRADRRPCSADVCASCERNSASARPLCFQGRRGPVMLSAHDIRSRSCSSVRAPVAFARPRRAPAVIAIRPTTRGMLSPSAASWPARASDCSSVSTAA